MESPLGEIICLKNLPSDIIRKIIELGHEGIHKARLVINLLNTKIQLHMSLRWLSSHTVWPVLNILDQV